MNVFNRTAVKAATAVAVILAVAVAARVADEARGVLAGVAVVGMAFTACWVVFQYRQLRHPAPARRTSRGRDPEAAGSPLALTEGQPTRIAA